MRMGARTVASGGLGVAMWLRYDLATLGALNITVGGDQSMKRLLLLATTLSLAIVLVSTQAMWGQEKETVGSLPAKGFEVRGVAAIGTPYVVMQKGPAGDACRWSAGARHHE